MFEAKLAKGDVLKKIVSALKELIEQASWDLTEEGIQLQSMDSSHVALVQMMLHHDSFEAYRCDQNIAMGLNMEHLNKVFAAFSQGTVQLQCEDESDSVKFVFEDEKKQRKQSYELRLMDLDVEQLGIPDQEYQASFSMPSSEFTKIIKDMLVIGETVTISVTKGGVQFKTDGEIGKADVHLYRGETIDDEENDNSGSLELDVQEPIDLAFATQYLKKFTAASSLAKNVTVSLSKDVPMVICYEMEDVGHLKYFLAPKIDDDDDAE